MTDELTVAAVRQLVKDYQLDLTVWADKNKQEVRQCAEQFVVILSRLADNSSNLHILEFLSGLIAQQNAVVKGVDNWYNGEIRLAMHKTSCIVAAATIAPKRSLEYTLSLATLLVAASGSDAKGWHTNLIDKHLALAQGINPSLTSAVCVIL